MGNVLNPGKIGGVDETMNTVVNSVVRAAAVLQISTEDHNIPLAVTKSTRFGSRCDNTTKTPRPYFEFAVRFESEK